MSDGIERAQEGLEHAHEADEAHPKHNDRSARRVAILISVIAATLAIAEMQEKGSQNEYLTHHIAASDAWAFYQAKTVRADIHRDHADQLESLPNAADPEVRKRIDAAHATIARLDDDEKTQGRKQLQEQAREKERQRDEAFHHYHHYELVVGGLQIAIVLASVSVVTRMPLLAMAAGLLGGASALYGIAVYAGLA